MPSKCFSSAVFLLSCGLLVLQEFVLIVGESIGMLVERLLEQVLEDIRYYLKQTDLSIKQVCDRLGFPNPSFFGKYVKDHFGMTPMQLRGQ